MTVDITNIDMRLAAVERTLTAGTTLASFEGGNFGYQMVDATYNARCRFLIPTRTVRINKALLHFSLQPFRSGAASGTSAGTSGGTSANHVHNVGYSTGTESGGHSHATASANHDHLLWTSAAASTGIGTLGVPITPGDGLGSGNFLAPAGPLNHSSRSDVSGGAGGTSGGENASHTHTAGGVTVGQSVDHSHSIPGSALSVPNSLYETGMAQGSHVYIDGTDVTSTLGGPWGTGSALDVHDLDVSQWLSAKGWHEVQISSTTIGGIFPSLAIFAVVGV